MVYKKRDPKLKNGDSPSMQGSKQNSCLPQWKALVQWSFTIYYAFENTDRDVYFCSSFLWRSVSGVLLYFVYCAETFFSNLLNFSEVTDKEK